MAKAPSFQYRGCRFDPWLGTVIPHASGQLSPHEAIRESPHTATKTYQNQKKKTKLANPKPAYPASPIPLHGNHYKDFCLTYLKWKTNKDLVYSTWNSVQCYVAAWMGQEFGGEWIHVCVWLSPFTVHLKPSQHC